jgi:hypothetical protein
VRKVTTIVAAIALLVLPAGANAGERKEATQDCRAERNAAGVENFRTLYDGFGECVTETKRENRVERRQARREAVADCDDQDLESTEATEDCVRSERKENLEEAEAHDQLELNAARDCRAERDEIGDEPFAEQYGTNHNKRNAFGKCVSGRVNELESEETETEEEAAPEDGEEVESQDEGDEETQPEDCEETTQPEDGEDTEQDDGEDTESDDGEETQPDDGEDTAEPAKQEQAECEDTDTSDDDA